MDGGHQGNGRFGCENVTFKLWEKRAVRPIGFFTALIGESNREPSESLAEREMKSTAFDGHR